MFWLTLVFCVVFSYAHPAWVAVFIILFDLYWLLKAVNSAIHIMSGYLKYKFFITIDWLTWLEKLGNLKASRAFLGSKIEDEKSPRHRVYLHGEVEKVDAALARGTSGK